MVKIWQIIKYEYTRHVFQKRFLFSLLSLPFAVVALVLVALLIASFSINSDPVGYIDRSGLLKEVKPSQGDGSLFEPVITFQFYQDEDLARNDLDAGSIQAYYIIPESYPDSLEIQLFYRDQPDSDVQSQFNQLIRENLKTFKDLDPRVIERLQSENTVTIAALDGSREMRSDQWFTIFTPYIAGIMFFIVVMTSGGYLLQAVVEEKENRTMEIVITSVTPNQLMTGKIIGNIGIGLTQLIAWLIFGWVGLKVAGRFWPVLEGFSLPPNYILVLLLVLLPAFMMVAAIMAAIGATVTEMREAQQVSSLFSLPIMVPYYLASAIMMNPNGSLAMILSYIPITAPITLLMRMSFTNVPSWQIALNIGILVIFALAAIWFAGRAFRMGMLRYGKRLSIKEILGKYEAQ